MKKLWLLYYRIHAFFARHCDRLHCHIQVSFKHFPFEVRINERFKPYVIWCGRVISLLSFVTIWLFGVPVLYAVIIGLILWCSSEVLSHFVFHYSAIFLQPIPFSVDDVMFENMAYVIAPDRSVPTMVGMIYSDEETAKKAFEYYHALVNELDEDINDQNIKIRAVMENGTYFFYLYPSEDRPALVDFREKQKDHAGGRPIMTFTMTCIVCKGLIKAEGITRFMSMYKNGEPYYLVPFLNSADGPEQIRTIQPILKHEFKIIKADEISKKDDPMLYKHYTMIVRTKQHPTFK